MLTLKLRARHEEAELHLRIDQEHRQSLLDGQYAEAKHSARPMVVAVRGPGRRAASDLRRRRRIRRLQLRRNGRQRRSRTDIRSMLWKPSTRTRRNRSTCSAPSPTATTLAGTPTICNGFVHRKYGVGRRSGARRRDLATSTAHRSHEARRREPGTGVQHEGSEAPDSASPQSGGDQGTRRDRPDKPEFRGRLAVFAVRFERERQDRLRGDHAPHLRHGDDQERAAVHRRFQRRAALSRLEDRQIVSGPTTCSRPAGRRR